MRQGICRVILRRNRGALDLQGQTANIGSMTVQTPTPFPFSAAAPDRVVFDRAELSAILGLYGRMVAAGEWRDYAMAFLRDRAVFSVFRHTAETPLYRIEKLPAQRHRQGAFAVFGAQGQTLKRGQNLTSVLGLLERKLIRPVD
jgi:hypothetical protein